jgi:hypothetical protein
MISQQTFFIPPEIQAGLVVGELVQYGGIVRNQAGEIVKHLKAIELPVNNERAAAAGLKLLKNPRIVSGAVVVAAAVAGAGALAAARKRTKAVPACVTTYNASLAVYLEAVREGHLDADIIGNLIRALDAVESHSDEGGSIALDFSTDQAALLVKLVIDSTKQLADDNSLDLDGMGEPVEGDNVIHLRRYLGVQRGFFEEAG